MTPHEQAFEARVALADLTHRAHRAQASSDDLATQVGRFIGAAWGLATAVVVAVVSWTRLAEVAR